MSQAGIGQLAAHNDGGDPWPPFPGHDRAAGSVALSPGARDKQWSLAPDQELPPTPHGPRHPIPQQTGTFHRPRRMLPGLRLYDCVASALRAAAGETA